MRLVPISYLWNVAITTPGNRHQIGWKSAGHPPPRGRCDHPGPVTSRDRQPDDHRCPRCGWPADRDGMRLLSTHQTTEGTVRYLRCVCGAHVVALAGRTVGATR